MSLLTHQAKISSGSVANSSPLGQSASHHRRCGEDYTSGPVLCLGELSYSVSVSFKMNPSSALGIYENWQFVAVCGSLWQFVAVRGSLWQFVARLKPGLFVAVC